MTLSIYRVTKRFKVTSMLTLDTAIGALGEATTDGDLQLSHDWTRIIHYAGTDWDDALGKQTSYR